MKAVVMAGGEGTRLRPLTSNQPKPMVPVAGKPCMEHIIELVHRHGIDEVIATLAFLPQIISGYFGSGAHLGVSLEYSVEEVPAGTAGSVKQCEHSLDESFLVISGDALTDFDLGALIEAHRSAGGLAMIGLKRVPEPAEFGVVLTAEDGRIERFVEKPSPSELFSDTINTGVYVLERELLERIPADTPYDFAEQLFPALLAAGAPLYGVELQGYWQDIGTVGQYMEANRAALDGEVSVRIPGTRLRENVHVGEGASVGDIDNIQGPAVIGSYCNVDPQAIVGRYTVLGNNVVMKEYAETQNCVVEANTYLGPRSQVRGAVVGKRCDLRAHAIVSEGVVMGDECSLGAQALIAPNLRVYPSKRIETGAQVSTSLIYEARGMEHLFGQEGVSGLVGVDVTPESATRLASAYGTALTPGERIVASRDAHPASRMIKRAMTAGLISTGASVEDLRVASSAQNRFEVKNSAAAGGIHVRMSDADPESVDILFFDGSGVALGEEVRIRVERNYDRHEYRHAPLGALGELAFPPRVTETYLEGLVGAVDVERIRDQRFRLVLDYAYSSAAMVMPALLRRLGVEHLAAHSFMDPDEATIATPDVAGFTDQTSKLVSAMGADLGVVLDRAAERIVLVDEQGEQIPPDAALFLVLRLVAKHARQGARVIVPGNTSRVAEAIVEPSGVVVERSRIASASLLRAAASDGVIFAGSESGAYVFPEFLPGYDGIMSLVKVLELLALERKPISVLCAEVPATTLIHKRTPVPWSLKGHALREVAAALRGEDLDLMDGVRVNHNGSWAQVVPDPEEPVFHIYAEGETSTESARLAERYRVLVEDVLAAAEPQPG